MAERSWPLGALVMRGPEFLFQAAQPLRTQAQVGDDLEVQLRYAVEEGSRAREDCHITFAVALDGLPAAQGEARVRDRPLLPDAVRGHVPVRVRPAREGQLKGTFTVEARLQARRWFGRGSGEAVFRQAGEFVVDVRKP